MSNSPSRPNPLGKAAAQVSAVYAALSSLIGIAAWFGILNSTQVDALHTLGQVLPDTIVALGTILSILMGAGTALAAAFHTAGKAKSEVTPVADPRNDAGQPLVPAGPGQVF